MSNENEQNAAPSSTAKKPATRVYRVDIATKVSPGTEVGKSYLIRARSSVEAENAGLNKFLDSTSRTASSDDVAELVAAGVKIEVAG